MVLLQNEILERVALGEPLADTALSLCLSVENILPDVVCSILTVDAEGLLHPLAGPSLPPGYSDLIEGIPAGPQVGSCGAAIYSGHSVEAQDIATDPRWAPFAAMPLAAGLRACWSTPITGRDGGVLGAFAFYFRQARRHTDHEAEVVRASIHLCAIALERDQQAAAQHRLAYSDMLTDLPNRAAFNVAAERLAVEGAPPCGLLIVDLDNLKTVNDTFGHRAGDDLLRAAAGFIEASARPHRAFRMGGDEFAILVVGTDAEPARLEAIAQAVLKQLATPVDCDGRLTVPRATIGGASGSGANCALDELQQNADFALYHAKETKRGGFVAYSVDLGATMTHRLRVIRDVGEALEEERVDAYYQPIVRIDTGEIVGLEALFRVITRDGQIKTAGDYFEATSDVHTATRLTRRMLGIVARDIRGWLDRGIWFQHIGFNLASADFQHDNLVEVIKTAFARQNVPLEHVILEVTEGVYMGLSGEAVARQIQSMRASGLKVALDDFGTGFASLTHLLSVPVDIIKIDKSFVARMEPQSRAAAIVEGLLSIAAKLGIKVVAEGVETQSQADQLEAFGCVLGQGYLYSKAIDRRAVTELLFEKAQKRDLDIVPPAPAAPTDLTGPLAPPPPADPNAKVVRYAVLLCGPDWRVVSERRRFGRFKTRSAAFQCALRLAQEASASGIAVELLHADSGGQLNSFVLPPSHPPEEEAEVAPPKRAAMN